MSLHSKISNVAVTLDTIGELMKKFRQEMFDVLLFVNNLEEIAISDVPRTRAGVSVVEELRLCCRELWHLMVVVLITRCHNSAQQRRTDWNSTLITQVIFPAYKRLLESCKEKSFPSLDGVTSHMRVDIVEGMF